MDIAPDLSHLTEDERKIIEAVIHRQQAEEKRDAVLIQSRQDDHSAPMAMPSRRPSQVRSTAPGSVPNESGVCCEICQKTKFVDEQSARQCSVCQKRFCVRCGVRLKGHQHNKPYWLCSICRQKQERYFSSRKFIPSTSSVSQLTSTSNNLHNATDETSKHISKQYVSDYILSQPFNITEHDEDTRRLTNNGAKPINPSESEPRKRMLPTAHIRRAPVEPVEETPTAASSAESISAVDENDSVPRVNKSDADDLLSALQMPGRLKDFQCHSLEEKDESTLKDSGIDTASSSTILNVLPIDPSKQPMTTWRWNESRTEQIGYVHLKNHTWTSTLRDDYQQGRAIKGDIFSALGLEIQGGICQENDDGSTTIMPEISQVTPGSIADHCGQLQIGDQLLEWNGHQLKNLPEQEVYRIIAANSMQTADIHLIVKRSRRYSTLANDEPAFPLSSQEHETPTKKNESNIQLQLSFQANLPRREFHVVVHGARDLHLSQGSLACQLSVQSKEQKCTKPQTSSAGRCTWNQRLTFFDIDTLDNLSLWATLIDLDRNEETLGEICICLNESNFHLHGSPHWYDLSAKESPRAFRQSDSDMSEDHDQPGSSFNRVLPTVQTNHDLLPSLIDTVSTGTRKRQLPNIPAAQLHANREKVSQDLIQKATQLKLRLHMEQQQKQRGAEVDAHLNDYHHRNESAQQKRQMYEDRIQIFNNEAHRPTIVPLPSASSQRASFHSSKSIDAADSHPTPLSTKTYESLHNLSEKNIAGSMPSGLKEKSLSRPRIPIIRDKSAPNTPHLNPSLSRRTTTAGQYRIEAEKNKDKYRKTVKKREPSETPGDDVDSDGSELSTVSKISSVSMLSTQSERPRTARKTGVHQNFHRHDEVQLNEEELRQMAMRTHETMIHPSSSASKAESVVAISSTPMTTNKSDTRTDGTLSDSVLSNQPESGKKRRPSMSSKALVILGLSKKTNSTSNLGHGKRFGFQRSEEIGVQPHLRSRTLQRQTSKENETPSSAPVSDSSQSPLALSHQRDQHHSMPHDMKLWSGGLKLPHEHQFADFIEGLGAGQLVGRQVLASPCHGEIQVGLRDQHGLLEVEIVRARNLLQKPVYKMPPAPYVKVYLLDGKTCIEKQRTRTTRRTLDPLIQQTLIFKENYRDKVLQIGVWGDYGKLDRKVFMGVCQINLEDLRLSTAAQVLDWYKLFSTNSLMNNYSIVQQSPRRTISASMNDSFSSFKSNSRS